MLQVLSIRATFDIQKLAYDTLNKVAVILLIRQIDQYRTLARISLHVPRKTKNNPVLPGEPGVGKTVARVSTRVIRVDELAGLKDKRLHFDMGGAGAGAK